MGQMLNEVLSLVHPYGVLRNHTTASLSEQLQDSDGVEEFEEQWNEDRQATLALLIAQFDPNGLHNPAEKAAGVATWRPPLLTQLGLRGVYDPASRQMRVEKTGTVLVEDVVDAPCHAAALWNRVLVPLGFEILDLYTGGDDHSFIATTTKAADGLRQANVVRVMKPCPKA
jgi:hypothetical protein